MHMFLSQTMMTKQDNFTFSVKIQRERWVKAETAEGATLAKS